MPRIFYMLEKECLEHRIVVRLPVFLLLLGLFILSYIIFVMGDASNVSFEMHYQGTMTQTPMLGVRDGLFSMISIASGMLSLILTFLYLPKTFLKARQEGSLMFWRSMPVTDFFEHSVKLIFALLVIPFICSLLLLSAELFLYLISFFYNNALLDILGPISLSDIAIHYAYFLEKMLLLSFAVLPVACLLLCLSQWLNAPMIVFFVAYFALKILFSYLFDVPTLSLFIDQFSRLPLDILFSHDALAVILNVGWGTFVIAYIFAGVCLLLSMNKSKYAK